jgi:hypothetical protein
MAEQYWFPAKRYGFGWSLPQTWQGWVVLLAYLAVAALGLITFPPNQEPVVLVCFEVFIAVALVIVCWIKGEPLRWRWGRD